MGHRNGEVYFFRFGGSGGGVCPGSSEDEVISGVGSSVSKDRKRCSISWTWSPSDFSMFMVDDWILARVVTSVSSTGLLNSYLLRSLKQKTSTENSKMQS